MAVQWPLTAKTAFVTALKLLQTVIVNNKQFQDITINAIQKKKKIKKKKKKKKTKKKKEDSLHARLNNHYKAWNYKKKEA